MRTSFLLAGLAGSSLVLLSACASSKPSTSTSSHDMNSMPSMTMSTSPGAPHSSATSGMAGMPMSSGTGLASTANGYTLTAPHITPMAGMDMPVTFTISKDGKPVTKFDPEQTKLLHFYLIRSDLSGFQHLHPAMAADGTWTVTPAAVGAGSYRFYVQFLPHANASDGALVLSRPFSVAGADATTSAAVPAPSAGTTVDGYTINVAGTPKAGAETPLRLTFTRAGQPVTDLQPYLDTYAHVTALRSGDLAFAHLHPSGMVNGDHGGPTLTVNADLPEAGMYRLFIQFQTGGTLHTAAITLSAS
jgi:hypothetical protein